MTPGETWGISGPTFLAVFGVAAVVLVLANVAYRLIAFAGHDGRPGAPDGAEVAYLNGGARLAVYASLAGLRSARSIDVDVLGSLRADGPLPAGAGQLDQAVYHAAQRQVRVRDLVTDQWVGDALRQVQEGLTSAGLAPAPAQRQAARLLAATVPALAAVGVLRVFAGAANSRPIGYLLLLLAITVPVGLVLVFSVPRRTRAARRALADLRRRYGYLSPASRPALGMYGATGAAMGVGLFGVASLWAMDPGFAGTADIHRVSATSTGYGGTSGGDSGSHGGSGGSGGCGGGGCGGCGG
ncbi:TIGR04222 domain-containing membrane protein [Solwaraspora sp. WMMB335]|uniref:TIGR04222 domain-containing membrane protein n=1 Tax=Solwaraspora sp. WMMB335 TaxID=3404118 RepID=UPI003B945E80